MSKYLLALTAAGCAGIAVGVTKMFSVTLPQELHPEKYPLKAKEAIVKCLLSSDIHTQMEHLNKAKQVCATRYGHVSPQYNKLLCWQARLVSESGDCGMMEELLTEMIKKPHVGESVEDEVRRWQYAQLLMSGVDHKCSSDIRQACNNEYSSGLSRLPDFLRNKIKTNI